jgi:hypothetical protein
MAAAKPDPAVAGILLVLLTIGFLVAAPLSGILLGVRARRRPHGQK